MWALDNNKRVQKQLKKKGIDNLLKIQSSIAIDSFLMFVIIRIEQKRPFLLLLLLLTSII